MVTSARAGMLERRWYASLQQFTDAMVLSVLWVLACLPVLTIGPATAAMFTVVRASERGRMRAMPRLFVQAFIANFLPALAIQAIVTLVAIGVVVDLRIVAGMSPEPRFVGQLLALVAGLVVLGASVYVFPLLVNFDCGFRRLFRSSVMLAIGRPWTTLRCLALVALACGLTVVFPLAPLLVPAVVATTIYRLCDKVFDEVAVP